MDSATAATRGWAQYFSDGRPYYHNPNTGVTQWDRPAEYTGMGSISFSGDAKGASNSRGGSGETPSGLGSALGFSSPFGADSPEVIEIDETRSTRNSGGASLAKSAAPVLEPFPKADASFGGDQGKFLCFDIGYLRTFFDITTQEVLFRLMLALFPFKALLTPPNDKASDFRDHPDWYGPIWVSTTTVIMVFSTSNYARWIGDRSSITDFAFLGVAAAVIYGCLFILPALAFLVAWVLSKVQQTDSYSSIGFRSLVCIFGYSFLTYIPASVVCLTPSSAVKWAALVVGLLWALAFTVTCFLRDISSSNSNMRYALFAYVLISHTAIFVCFRLYFFHK